MSDNSKSSESRSKWNPFQKVISMMTGRSGSSSSSASSSDGDKVIYRWTASCLNATCPIFSKNPQFNMVYTPAPSLLMFTVITLSSENAMTKTLQKLFELTDADIDEIREMSCKLNDIKAPRLFYFFVRFLVDEERTTTVCKELMTKSNDVANQQVFVSVRPSRAIKFLSSLAFTNVTLARPSLLTTNGYGSVGLTARWIGKTRKAGLHRFASTYCKRKLEPFFEIRTSYKRVTMKEFEVIEVPFQVGRTQGSLVLLRPHFIGNLPYANRELSTEVLLKIVAELSATMWQQGRLLLPQFGASVQHDLWKNLMRHGVQPDLGQSQKAPPMASLWHWASLQVSSDGIGAQSSRKTEGTPSQRALEQECRGRISGESLFKSHKTYSVRLDSPFTYLIQLDSIPIFTGSWFGSPPPKSSEMFMNAPERIRQHRTLKTKRRPRAKETRKQKLLKKLKKSEEREREKDRKRAKKPKSVERFSDSNTSESTTNTTTTQSTSSATSSASSSISSSSRSEKSEKKVTSLNRSAEPAKKKEKEAEPKSKSKSNGWRKIANRVFGKKN